VAEVEEVAVEEAVEETVEEAVVEVVVEDQEAHQQHLRCCPMP
jgi:hypothetical protein